MAREDFDRTIADITATRDGLNRTLEMLVITREAIYPPEPAAAPQPSPAVTRPPPEKPKRNGKPHEAGPRSTKHATAVGKNGNGTLTERALVLIDKNGPMDVHALAKALGTSVANIQTTMSTAFRRGQIARQGRGIYARKVDPEANGYDTRPLPLPHHELELRMGKTYCRRCRETWGDRESANDDVCVP